MDTWKLISCMYWSVSDKKYVWDCAENGFQSNPGHSSLLSFSFPPGWHHWSHRVCKEGCEDTQGIRTWYVGTLGGETAGSIDLCSESFWGPSISLSPVGTAGNFLYIVCFRKFLRFLRSPHMTTSLSALQTICRSVNCTVHVMSHWHWASCVLLRVWRGSNCHVDILHWSVAVSGCSLKGVSC